MVYSFTKPDRVEHCVIFWDTKNGEVGTIETISLFFIYIESTFIRGFQFSLLKEKIMSLWILDFMDLTTVPYKCMRNFLFVMKQFLLFTQPMKTMNIGTPWRMILSQCIYHKKIAIIEKLDFLFQLCLVYMFEYVAQGSAAKVRPKAEYNTGCPELYAALSLCYQVYYRILSGVNTTLIHKKT